MNLTKIQYGFFFLGPAISGCSILSKKHDSLLASSSFLPALAMFAKVKMLKLGMYSEPSALAESQ